MTQQNVKKNHLPGSDIGRESQKEHIEYSRDVVHRHSPAIQKLYDLCLSYVPDVEEAVRTKGGKAIWCGPAWAMPVILAAGYEPLEYSELSRLGGQEAIVVAEDYFQMPPETCSMVKTVTGELYKRKGNGINRIFCNCSVCEPYNLTMEMLRREDYEVYSSDVIYRAPGVVGDRHDDLRQFFVQELIQFNEWLTGTHEIDKEKVSIELARRNRLMTKMGEIMALRINHPFYVKSLAVMYLFQGLNSYFAKPEEYEKVLDDLIAELKALGDEPEDQDKAIPLIWTGGSGQEYGVYEAVDEANGALLDFVAIAPYEKMYNLEIDPLDAIAHWQLDSMNAGASVYMRDVIEQKIEHVHARGMIQYGIMGCSMHSVAREMFRDYFHKKGIPSISIEGVFQVGPPSGQVLTRINAFIEMLS
jgi:benzoyl-CoA reductase/2-hydroxyglutaryl-CoA dehydratase subunit BcrC/BadD/HgdB